MSRIRPDAARRERGAPTAVAKALAACFGARRSFSEGGRQAGTVPDSELAKVPGLQRTVRIARRRHKGVDSISPRIASPALMSSRAYVVNALMLLTLRGAPDTDMSFASTEICCIIRSDHPVVKKTQG